MNNSICPCLFIKKLATEFAIIAVYVDDLNLIGTPEELIKTINYLKKKFEMKDLGKTKYCLDLLIEHCSDDVLIHQSTYTEKVLKYFHMDKSHPLSSPMVVRLFKVTKDPFRPKEENEELLGPEVPYLSAIGKLLYLANYTRPDITFSVNSLARYSSAPTKRHWNKIKHVLRYLCGKWNFLFQNIGTTNFRLCRCRLSFRPSQISITDRIYNYLWKYCYILEVSKQWWPHPPTIQKYLPCMKLVENVFG